MKMVCKACGESRDVRLIERRIRWGAAVRAGKGTGYTGRPVPYCADCRHALKAHNFKYHTGEPT